MPCGNTKTVNPNIGGPYLNTPSNPPTPAPEFQYQNQPTWFDGGMSAPSPDYGYGSSPPEPQTFVSLYVVNLEAHRGGNFVTLSTSNPFRFEGEGEWEEISTPEGYLILEVDYSTWSKLMVGMLVPAQMSL